MSVPVRSIFPYVFNGILYELISFELSLSNAYLSKVEGHERYQLVQRCFDLSVIDKFFNGRSRA